MSLRQDQLDDFQRRGFLVLAELFDRNEISRLAAEADRLLIERADLISPRNLRCRFQPHVTSGESLFEVFDPVCDISPVCEEFASDPRVSTVLRDLLREPFLLFKDKLIYKPPGARGYELHQDIPANWPGFPKSFQTVLIAIDSMSVNNGCTVVYPGLHQRGFLAKPGTSGYPLPEEAVGDSEAVPLELAPGDVAIFGGLVPHRSAPNQSPGSRRALYLSFNAVSEGGDRRQQHYREFHDWMRQRQPGGLSAEVMFW